MTTVGLRLRGRRIVVCRAVHQAAPLVQALEAEGAEVVHVPLIEVAPPIDGGVALRAALVTADESTWVAVTSANGVDAVNVAARGSFTDSGSTAPGSLAQKWRLAVVGAATAARATECALRVDFESPKASGAGLGSTLPVASGERVIAAVAALARPDLPEALGIRGINTRVVTAYRTEKPEMTAADRTRVLAADAVLVTAPSVIHRLVDELTSTELPALIAIGETTASAIDGVGLPTAAVAETSTIDGLIDAAIRTLAE